jgi:hypothetical protein
VHELRGQSDKLDRNWDHRLAYRYRTSETHKAATTTHATGSHILHQKNLSLLSTSPPPLVSLLGNGELDTLALGQRDLGLGTLSDNENVRESECQYKTL